MKRLLMGLLLIFGLSANGWALPMTFGLLGVNDSNNQASVGFAYDPGLGKIFLDITNTSALYDPRLTSFAFNAPSQVTGISSFTGPTGWHASYDLNNINTLGQYGQFDVAGLTGSNFNGGDPNDGIPRGATFSFAFTLTGTGLNLLTELSFLDLLSFDAPRPPTENTQYFIGRFQRTGVDGEGSDIAIPTGSPAPVPEPGTLFLLGTGLLGLAIYGRKRMKG
jgi:hypothetical protein